MAPHWPSRHRPGTDKLRNGLDRLVADPSLLDARLPGLVRGYRPGELAVFAMLSQPNDAVHLQRLKERGARVLRSYRTAPVVAIAATSSEVRAVADLAWVEWMIPVDVIVALDHEREVDQSARPTGTPIDLGVPGLWDQGITGAGTRIAILDTGMDLTHQDLDDLDFRHWNNGSGDVPDPSTLRKVVDARNFNVEVCAAPGSGGFDGHGTRHPRGRHRGGHRRGGIHRPRWTTAGTWASRQTPSSPSPRSSRTRGPAPTAT